MSDEKTKQSNAVKIERRVKERDSLCKGISDDIAALADKVQKLTEHDIKTYSMLVGPDCLYMDSPIGRAFTFEWIKQQMIKLDLDFVGYFLDGKSNIKPFVERGIEASKWIMRFTKEAEAPKTGLQAIV